MRASFLRYCLIYLVFLIALVAPVGVNLNSEQEATIALPVPVASASEQKKVPEQKILSEPVKIEIPRLNIFLAIEKGYYDETNKTWSVSDTAANFAMGSAMPNSSTGVTVIYGHNLVDIFEPTKNLKKGDIVYLYTEKGETFKYRYTNARVVMPQDTSIFNSADDAPKLALITCSGVWSESRRLMEFEYVNIEKEI